MVLVAGQERLTWPQVLAWRTGQSHLAAPSGDGPVEVARRLRGVQAQVMSSAELALSVRTKGARPADVQDALWRDRSLVKTWTARGTLHLVPSDELALWCAAMQARGAYWAKPAWERYHGVSADDMERILGGLDEALHGRCLTRQELASSKAQIYGSILRARLNAEPEFLRALVEEPAASASKVSSIPSTPAADTTGQEGIQ